MEIDFDRLEDTARRECLQWWLESVSSSGGQWWPIPSGYPERGNLPHDEWAKVLSWNQTLVGFLVPLGLLRCRSLVQLSYASDYPHALQCVVDWSGPADEWKARVCQALIADKHWPHSWPEDLELIATNREDWHVSFPLNLRLIASLGALLNPLPEAERVEKLLELCSTPKPFEIQKARIEGISFSDGQWFGTPEQDLRTDIVGELEYPFSSTESPKTKAVSNETGPFQLQWLKWIFEADHDSTLKKNLGDSLRGSGQEWFVSNAKLKTCPNWKASLQSKADDETIARRTRSRLKSFLSLQ